MSNVPCRWGWDCHRPDCWYAHPTGRAMDAAGSAASISGPASLSTIIHPSLQPTLQPQLVPSSVSGISSVYSTITKPITSSNLNGSVDSDGSKRGPTVCRYGRECRRSECWFSHPEGRELDDKSANVDDYDEALDEFEGKAPTTIGGTTAAIDDEDEFSDEDEEELAYRLATGDSNSSINDSFNCPCCHGDPQHCSTATCVAAGICACQADRIVDETWKDEWFAASRTCDCCEGYVYRCKKQRDSCKRGKCYCANDANVVIPTMNGVHSQAATAS